MKQGISRCLICIAVAAAAMASTLPGTASVGVFEDGDGAKHAWSVNEAHALVWDGAPYMPFGVVFEPKYLTSGQTDADWAADEADVAAFKLAGIRDVIVRSGKGMSAVPLDAWQRVVDLLEANELRYGIELNDSPYEPLVGYVVAPAVNREDGIRVPGEVVRNFPDAKLAVYVLCDAKTAEIYDLGQEIVVNTELRILVEPPGGTTDVLLIYPQRVVAPGSADWGLPDLWSDYDKHRDRLVFRLSMLKFGKGLRFFIDPFTDRIGVHGDVDSLYPTSYAFRLEYAAWLARKYYNARDLNLAWGVLRHDLSSFTEAARLVPLWKQGRGVPAVYDEEAGKYYQIDVPRCSLWRDFLEFRAESVRGYMNSMADALKRLVVDVPVVFTATGLQPIFQNAGGVGYDGLAVPVAGGRDSSVTNAVRAFSLAENSTRKMWIVSKMSAGDEKVYESKEGLFADINALGDLGVKGYFVWSAGVEAGVKSADLMLWLAEYASVSAADARFVGRRPRAIYFPDGSAHTRIERFASGVWWLPTLNPGRDLQLGPAIAGYALARPGGVDLYVWSLKGRQTIHVAAGGALSLTATTGDKTEARPKKGRVEIVLDDEPVLVQGIPAEQFLPVEAVELAVQDLEKAIARAEKKNLDVSGYKHTLQLARRLIKKNELAVALDMARVTAGEIELRLQGLEDETPVG